jgi:hypothetical protein
MASPAQQAFVNLLLAVVSEKSQGGKKITQGEFRKLHDLWKAATSGLLGSLSVYGLESALQRSGYPSLGQALRRNDYSLLYQY